MVAARAVVIAVCVLAGVLVGPTASGQEVPPDGGEEALTVAVLSPRPELVSGGDVLVRVDVPRDVALDDVVVRRNGEPVPAGAVRADPGAHSLLGLIEGLRPGENDVVAEATSPTGEPLSAGVVVTNHLSTGPVFSGPHQEPFICETTEWGFGPPLDEHCSVATRVSYLYRTTGGTFEPLEDPTSRPADLAQTTTLQGHTVDYVVRLEQGTINRAVYEIAVLDDPDGPGPDPWTPTLGWNGRLVYTFGGGCNAGFHQGRSSGGVLEDVLLSQGYALASSTLNVQNNNCNDVLSAETVLMVKEHFVERYGAPRHTIGWGTSGGAIQQYLIAQNYPGLLDGITPGRSYPDAVTIFPGIVDCTLLIDYFDEAGELGWTAEQQAAVSGYATWQTCLSWEGSFTDRIDPDEGCDPAIPPELVYDAETNPDGVRCTYHDHLVTIFGEDPATGFARRPLDNVGVQYGLEALRAGTITPEQFVDLNEGIGGFDVDANVVEERTVADPEALTIAYETGRVVSGAGALSTTPIIDVRGYRDPLGDIHDRFRSFSVRERLIEANGHADNQVILTTPNTELFDEVRADALGLMDRWLSNLAATPVSEDRAADVVAAKPPELVDACWTARGEKVAEPATYQGPGVCNQLYPSHADPRVAAGAPLANDVLKCQLQPVEGFDYGVDLTDELRQRLVAAFPEGVCDYDQPGVGQVPATGTWRSYGEGATSEEDRTPL